MDARETTSIAERSFPLFLSGNGLQKANMQCVAS